MFRLPDEHIPPPDYKSKIVYALIVVNALMFFMEIALIGQFFEFINQYAFAVFYNWGAVPNCVTGATASLIDFGAGPVTIPCPDVPYVSLLSSIFIHGGLIHFGGNMLVLWLFGRSIEFMFGRLKFLGIYLLWGVLATLIHVMGDPFNTFPVIGASGAISGVLGASVIMLSTIKLPSPLMIQVPTIFLILPWFIFQNIYPFFVGGFGIAGGGITFLVHIGGFVIGLVTGYLYKKKYSQT